MRIVLIVLVAVIWVTGVSAALYFVHPNAFPQMSPGEWGEYLSGAFGPPSFLAVVAALIQQGDDLKRQQQQLEEQLKGMERQIGAQLALAESAKAQSESMLQQTRAASAHAEAATRQTALYIERLQIERITNRANSLAMLSVRYSDRLIMRPANTAGSIALIGDKSELRQDFELGPEAVLETVRQRARAQSDQLKTLPSTQTLSLTLKNKQSMESLLSNLINRASDLSIEFDKAPPLPEVTILKSDLALNETVRRLTELLDLVKFKTIS
ncbi:MAG: hypothetical protein QM759_06810 [Terricaulis sp.]